MLHHTCWLESHSHTHNLISSHNFNLYNTYRFFLGFFFTLSDGDKPLVLLNTEIDASSFPLSSILHRNRVCLIKQTCKMCKIVLGL